MLNRLQYLCTGFLFSLTAHASFIESTVGTAIVNDATATYYNPAALVLIKNMQFVALGSLGRADSNFTGEAGQVRTGFNQSGTTDTRLNYFLPSGYYAMPIKTNWRLGLSVVGNDFNKDLDGFSLLRYAQSNNKIENIDFVPAIAYKINEFISVGAGFNRSYAHFLLKPISGLPRLNIPDAESLNESSAEAFGGDLGLLLKPTKATVIGINHRSSMTFRMRGTSTFNGVRKISSDNYHFNYWIPARTAFSISHFLTKKFGLIGTVQYIQWNIFKENTIYNIATAAGIIPAVKVPYHLHNSWLFTAGSNYHFSKKWIIRVAGSYVQSPSTGKFQIDHGDSITLGASMAYTPVERITLDVSYAHAFFKSKDIHILNAQNAINGIDKGSVNAVSLKLTVNI
jgi:long-subunit fatty acid transport protein